MSERDRPYNSCKVHDHSWQNSLALQPSAQGVFAWEAWLGRYWSPQCGTQPCQTVQGALGNVLLKVCLKLLTRQPESSHPRSSSLHRLCAWIE